MATLHGKLSTVDVLAAVWTALTDVRYVWAVLTAAQCCLPDPKNPDLLVSLDITVGAHDLSPYTTTTQGVGRIVQGAGVSARHSNRQWLASVISEDAVA